MRQRAPDNEMIAFTGYLKEHIDLALDVLGRPFTIDDWRRTVVATCVWCMGMFKITWLTNVTFTLFTTEGEEAPQHLVSVTLDGDKFHAEWAQ